MDVCKLLLKKLRKIVTIFFLKDSQPKANLTVGKLFVGWQNKGCCISGAHTDRSKLWIINSLMGVLQINSKLLQRAAATMIHAQEHRCFAKTNLARQENCVILCFMLYLLITIYCFKDWFQVIYMKKKRVWSKKVN